MKVARTKKNAPATNMMDGTPAVETPKLYGGKYTEQEMIKLLAEYAEVDAAYKLMDKRRKDYGEILKEVLIVGNTVIGTYIAEIKSAQYTTVDHKLARQLVAEKLGEPLTNEIWTASSNTSNRVSLSVKPINN